MSTISIAEANFVDRMINGKYRVKMPEFLAKHDSFDNWEPERFQSMEENLKDGDLLFDVGAETGHMSAIYARFVGAKNIVLFESNPDNWQNIWATWQAEGLEDPRATFCGLVSDKTEIPKDLGYTVGNIGEWPSVAFTGRIWTPRSYRYIHEHAHNTMQISLDNFTNGAAGNAYVCRPVLSPRGITIDVEGAEFNVLAGAKQLLRHERPLVWVSIHVDLMLAHYRRTIPDLRELMEKELGYQEEFLAADHEIHMLYRPRA